ncbi:MAG: NAD/NADP octopine/nopaline dehydrogenase family protein [Deltaproteobacteria bacterium]|jgi:opine dehydrogenase|nr:NAD/NADP octopine/nopaline dehydrogenase family protein [Deltaproteobacteria bacterium]
MPDLSYLKNKPIAVLGAGAVGKAIAADCALAGAQVRLADLPQFKQNLGQIEGGLHLFGPQDNLYCFERSGRALLDMATTDIGQALKGAGLVVVASVAAGHLDFFKAMIPYLEDGMIVHIFPDNYGSLILRRLMREAGCQKRIVVGGWASAPYGCRVQVYGGVVLPKVAVEYRAVTLRGAALPSVDQEAFLESGKYLGCLDSVYSGDGPLGGNTVLDTGFSNVNPVLHCPGTILGVGTMENWGVLYGTFDKKDFSIYSHAYCPSISRIQYAFYQEEVAIAQALGVGIQLYDEEEFFSRKSILGGEFMGKSGFKIPFEEHDYKAMRTGPHTIHNRYITEDIPVGCHVYHLLGLETGVPTPIIDSMIVLASKMVQNDYFKTGYSLAHLGLANLDKAARLAYLNEGRL